MQGILEDNPKIPSNFVHERKRHNRFGDDRQKKIKQLYMVWTNLVFYCFGKERRNPLIIVLSFIAFTGLVLLLSWYKTRDDNLSTKEGYFLAGRGLSGLVIAGSLEMTNLSTE